jgi:hypothetical protein
MSQCKIVKFDFRNTLVTFQGVEIEGFAKEGDAITAEYREDGGDLNVSADGATALHVVNSDASGMITLKINQSSISNDFLEQMFALVKNGDDAMYGTVMLHDLNRNERWRLAPAYVSQPPTYAYGTEAKTGEWKVVGVCLENIGGDTFEIVASL